MRLPFQFKKIRTRLAVWFVVIATVPLLIATVIIYQQRVTNIKENQFQKLIVIRDLKVQQLENWLDEKESWMKSISGDKELRDLEKFFQKIEYDKSDYQVIDNMRKILMRYLANFDDFSELLIINKYSRECIVSTNRDNEGIDENKDPSLAEFLEIEDHYIKDIHECHFHAIPSMAFAIPIRCIQHNGKHIIGVLVARIHLEKSLFALLLDRTGLGKTGETLIVNKDLYALNELRHYDNAPLKLNITAEPAVNAVAGNTGIIESTDYRGEPALAAYTHIPRTGWGFVAKQDQKEVYASISVMLVNLFILVLVSILSIYIISFFLARITTKPILDMVNVAGKIGAGDYSARNTITTIDETAALARSINNFAGSIETQIYVTGGLGDITKLFIKSQKLKELSNALVYQLTELSQSQLGAIYFFNKESDLFEPFQSIGFQTDKLVSFDASSLEGEFGRTLSTREIAHLTDIPEDTSFLFKTVMGSAIPKEIINIPIIVKDEVAAIIAMASLSGYSVSVLELLQLSWRSMNTGFASILAEEEVRQIADELMDKNQELETLAEELKSQADELQEQNIELDEQNKLVEQANQLKGEFLSNMSHELRTPLNSVISLTNVLKQRTVDRLSEEEKNYLEVVERNGKKLLELINDILDLSKIESGQMDISLSTISLSGLVMDIAESLKPIAEDKGLDLRVNVAKDLPRVITDEFLVHRILQNIISNAVKFTEQGQVLLTVKSRKDQVFVAVKDTGIGIPADRLDDIFDEFRQLDGTTARRFEGTGLGLAIAKRSANLLSGDILVESKENEGSTFTLVLPIELPETINTVPRFNQITPTDSKKRTNRLLIVEDQDSVAIQLTAILEQAGFKVDTATGGQAAIDFCKESVPDGIILDLMMPEVDGFMVLESIRSRSETKKVPVLILTAKDLTQSDLKRLNYNNIQQLVQKGDIDKAKFLKKVDMMLGIERKPGKIPEDKTKSPQTEKIRKRAATTRDIPIILIVEDNPDNMTSTKAVLPSDYSQLEATDGQMGLEMIQTHRPDLILMDIMLPKMDGLAVLKQVRADKNLLEIPIIAITAKAMKGDKEKMLEAGFDDYIAKPIEVDILIKKIKALLKK